MMKVRYNELNPLQKYIVDSIIKLVDKNEPFFANVQGGGGTGKSFIIKYIAA
jgi:pantothenate kinase-related protein Tda10